MSMPSGIVCTPLEYEESLRNHSIHCLTRGDGIGLTVIAEAAFFSLVALLCVFLLILRSTFCHARRTLQVPMELLILSLLLADVLQAIGGILSVKWIYDGKVVVGSFCNAQGILQNVGETGVALNTLAIAIYTLISVWFMKGPGIQSIKLTLWVLSVLWGFILIVATVGNTINRGLPNYNSPTPYWCWISETRAYLPWRIFSEYFWFWFALLLSLVTYIPIGIYLWNNSRPQRPNDDGQASQRLFLNFLAYPAVYCVIILPTSIARWIGFVQQDRYGANFVPSAAIFFGGAIFRLSGFFNVLLLLTTKSGLFGLRPDREEPPVPLGDRLP